MMDTENGINMISINEQTHSRFILHNKSNIQSKFPVKNSLKMLYHFLIDHYWPYLLMELFIIQFLIYFLFSLIFYIIHPINTTANNYEYWFMCFNFVVQTAETIGYGHLTPKEDSIHTFTTNGVFLILLTFVCEIFTALMIGIFFRKLSKPSKLKSQLLFSKKAVINHGLHTGLKFQTRFRHEFHSDWNLDYGRIHDCGKYFDVENEMKNEMEMEYQCFIFRFVHTRPHSRMCMPSFHLLYFENESLVDQKCIEMEFELNIKRRGRLRSHRLSVPLLSLPWMVVHKIDEQSPLFGMTHKDMMDKKIEIIGIVGAIDECVSENYQSWFSYTFDDILFDYRFEPMVSAVVEYQSPYFVRFCMCLFCCWCGPCDVDQYRNDNQSFCKWGKKEVMEIDVDRLSAVFTL